MKILCKLLFAIMIQALLFSGCKSGHNIKDTKSAGSIENKNSPQLIQDNRLHQAALNGDAVEILRLLDEKRDVNMRDQDGRTALMYASYNGHTEIVNELLKKGAKINERDQNGRTALMFAASGPFTETVRLLLDNKAEPDMADGEEHFTALMYAAAEGQLAVVRVLLEGKADPTLKDVDGDNAVTFATKNGHKEVADLIMSYIYGRSDIQKIE
jgi:ankyrin repeat protein